MIILTLHGCCVSHNQYAVTKPVVSVPVGKCRSKFTLRKPLELEVKHFVSELQQSALKYLDSLMFMIATEKISES